MALYDVPSWLQAQLPAGYAPAPPSYGGDALSDPYGTWSFRDTEGKSGWSYQGAGTNPSGPITVPKFNPTQQTVGGINDPIVQYSAGGNATPRGYTKGDLFSPSRTARGRVGTDLPAPFSGAADFLDPKLESQLDPYLRWLLWRQTGQLDEYIAENGLSVPTFGDTQAEYMTPLSDNQTRGLQPFIDMFLNAAGGDKTGPMYSALKNFGLEAAGGAPSLSGMGQAEPFRAYGNAYQPLLQALTNGMQSPAPAPSTPGLAQNFMLDVFGNRSLMPQIEAITPYTQLFTDIIQGKGADTSIPEAQSRMLSALVGEPPTRTDVSEPLDLLRGTLGDINRETDVGGLNEIINWSNPFSPTKSTLDPIMLLLFILASLSFCKTISSSPADNVNSETLSPESSTSLITKFIPKIFNSVPSKSAELATGIALFKSNLYVHTQTSLDFYKYK